jgi:hypothetical protein
MNKFAPSPLTAEDVRAYRDKTGAGMMEAKRVLQARKDIGEIINVRNMGTLREQVDWLLSREEARIRAHAPSDGA